MSKTISFLTRFYFINFFLKNYHVFTQKLDLLLLYVKVESTEDFLLSRFYFEPIFYVFHRLTLV